MRLIRRAASVIYSSPKYERRGEFGELILHVLLRQVFNSIPAISKFYYKDSPNDTVKGFDAVHVVASSQSLELWLGEVKFYSKISQAIADVVEELKIHGARDYLRKEFLHITNKIDPNWPHAERLQKLLDPNTSLDQIFSACCVGVLLTYDSDAVKNYGEVSKEYIDSFKREVLAHHKAFYNSALPPKLKVHLFLLPIRSKTELTKILDRKLKRWQQL